MSKLRKLIKKPRVFFRDYFLKRVPIDYGSGVALLPVEQGQKTKPIRASASKMLKEKPVRDSDFEDLYSIAFPIDIVFTWVDADDDDFIEQKSHYQDGLHDDIVKKKREIVDIARFQSRDELKYALRSIEAYAPWVNHVYIVTNGQVPKWLNRDNSKVSIVTHSEIIPSEYLPTFNSHVIESCLHRIEGLSEHYLYLNDDVMFSRPVSPSYFFFSSGLAKVFITDAKLPDGIKNPNDTPTQWAAKNARDLLYIRTSRTARNMFAHTFHPQLKTVQQTMESLWPNEFDMCRRNRFRNESDLPVASFLNHHFALIKGKAIAARTKCMYFNIRTPSASRHYQSLLARQGTEQAPFSMCLNDHKSSAKSQLENYEVKLQKFLDKYFPEESEFESSLPKKSQISQMIKHQQYEEVYSLLAPLAKNTAHTMVQPMKLYAIYYFGLAAKCLYEKNGDPILLSDAVQALNTVCKLNPKHAIARKHLEEITQTSEKSVE